MKWFRLLSVFLIVFLLFSFLASINLSFVPNVKADTYSTPSTVTTSTVATNALIYPWQRKSCYAATRFWMFLANSSTTITYFSSPNATTWDSSNVVFTIAQTFDFSIYWDGTYINYIRSPYASGNAVYYRRGVPYSNGTIVWDAEQTAVAGAVGIIKSYGTVTKDTAGYPWLGYSYYNATGFYTVAVNATATDGSAWGTPVFLSSTFGRVGSLILPMLSGKMYAVWCYYTPAEGSRTLEGKDYDGSAWNATVTTIQSNVYTYETWSAVSDQNNMYLTYLNGTSRYIDFRSGVSTGTWSAETYLSSNSSPYVCPTITKNGADLYVFWANVTANTIFVKEKLSGVWQSLVSFETGETNIAGGPVNMVSDWSVQSNFIGVGWINGTVLWNVRFAYLQIEMGTTLNWDSQSSLTYSASTSKTVSKSANPTATLTYTFLLKKTGTLTMFSNVLESFSNSIAKTVTETMSEVSSFAFSSVLTKTVAFSSSGSSGFSFQDSFSSTFALLSNVGNVLLAFITNLGKALSFQFKPQATLTYADSVSKTVSISLPLSAGLTFGVAVSAPVTHMLSWAGSGLFSFTDALTRTFAMQTRLQATFIYATETSKTVAFTSNPSALLTFNVAGKLSQLASWASSGLLSFFGNVGKTVTIQSKPQSTLAYSSAFLKTVSFSFQSSALLTFYSEAVYAKLAAGYGWFISSFFSFTDAISKSVALQSNPQASFTFAASSIRQWSFPFKPVTSLSFVDIGKALWNLAAKPQAAFSFTDGSAKTVQTGKLLSSSLTFNAVSKMEPTLYLLGSGVLTFTDALTKTFTVQPNLQATWTYSNSFTKTMSFSTLSSATLAFMTQAVYTKLMAIYSWIASSLLNFASEATKTVSTQSTLQSSFAYTGLSREPMLMPWTSNVALAFADALKETASLMWLKTGGLTFTNTFTETVSFTSSFTSALTFMADSSKSVFARLQSWSGSSLLGFGNSLTQTFSFQLNPDSTLTFSASSLNAFSLTSHSQAWLTTSLIQFITEATTNLPVAVVVPNNHALALGAAGAVFGLLAFVMFTRRRPRKDEKLEQIQTM